jgi:hypothetical protein
MQTEKGNIDSQKRNTAGTGDLLAFPFLGLLISSLLCLVLKFGSKRTLIMQYQRIVSESTANGRVNMSAIVTISMLSLSFVLGSVITTVRVLHTMIFYILINYRCIREQMYWAQGLRIVMAFPMNFTFSIQFAPYFS